MILLTSIAFSQRKVQKKQSKKTVSSNVSQGTWLIEANTGTDQTGNTSFGLRTGDGITDWSVGADAGYFIIDRLALKAGLGYFSDEISEGETSDRFIYKLGAKYYIVDKFPVGLDFTGESISLSNNKNDRRSWIGVQGGYAWFVSKNVAIEPTLRYNFTTDDLKAKSFLGAHIGFALFF